ncbi:MAG: Sel1 repeat [Sphingobacterium sp.]|jgi:TPR repeat protein|nr:Sel1 repeat [Sphingobacterium sp.]
MIETVIQLFTAASNQGQKYAQYDLGFLYDKGIGVPQDIEKAKELWQQAAAQGVGSAKVALEIMKEQIDYRNKIYDGTSIWEYNHKKNCDLRTAKLVEKL